MVIKRDLIKDGAKKKRKNRELRSKEGRKEEERKVWFIYLPRLTAIHSFNGQGMVNGEEGGAKWITQQALQNPPYSVP